MNPRNIRLTTIFMLLGALTMLAPIAVHATDGPSFSQFDAFAAQAEVQPEDPAELQDRVDELRRQIEDIRAAYMGLANSYGKGAHETMVAVFEPFETVTDEQLAELVKFGVDYSEVLAGARDLEDFVADAVEAAGNLSVDKTDDLPNAIYSPICGSVRTDADATFIASAVLQTAKGVHAGVSRVCDQVAVAAGFGGNGSVGCIPADIVLAAAEAGFLVATACDEVIDSAEILGSYRRLGHIHSDVADAKSTVIQSKVEVLTNANANRDLIQRNDNANTAAILDRSDANTGAIIGTVQRAADAGLQREVENLLRVRECTAWMYTPQRMGGIYESVVEVLENVIDNARTMSSVPADRIAVAEIFLNSARELAQDRPLNAIDMCRNFIGAYAEATPSGVDRVPID